MNVKIPSDIAPGDYLCKFQSNNYQLSFERPLSYNQLGLDISIPSTLDRSMADSQK